MGEVGDPPPQPIAVPNTTIADSATNSHFRLRGTRPPAPSNMAVKTNGIVPPGNSDFCAVVTGAVVFTVTVTVCGPLAPSCSEELDKLHVGAKACAGVMSQLRLTAPAKEPAGATARVNCAFCPAVTVC
jgi:hypothetical protein